MKKLLIILMLLLLLTACSDDSMVSRGLMVSEAWGPNVWNATHFQAGIWNITEFEYVNQNGTFQCFAGYSLVNSSAGGISCVEVE